MSCDSRANGEGLYRFFLTVMNDKPLDALLAFYDDERNHPVARVAALDTARRQHELRFSVTPTPRLVRHVEGYQGNCQFSAAGASCAVDAEAARDAARAAHDGLLIIYPEGVTLP